jgi:8-oxo-dGTP diphosphatase
MHNVYVPPILTIDGVVFQIIDGQLCVLLIRRQREPFAGCYALPGGYNPQGETTTEALQRIVQTKAGVDVHEQGSIEQLYTFDAIGRDPRGHAVSVVYMVLGYAITPVGSDTTQEPTFFPLTDLPELAYDHSQIIRHAHERLKARIGYTTTISSLLPKHFTLSQLQTAYEAVLCCNLDRRNFRKKFLALDVLEDIGETLREGAHRPAQLYRFKTKGVTNLTKDFDWS